jgi:hypothetical protein
MALIKKITRQWIFHTSSMQYKKEHIAMTYIRMPDLTEMVSLENQKRNCWRNSYTLDGTNFKGSGINVKAKRASSQMQSRVL